MMDLLSAATIPTPQGKSIIQSASCLSNLIEFSISILQSHSIFYPIRTSILRGAKSRTRIVWVKTSYLSLYFAGKRFIGTQRQLTTLSTIRSPCCCLLILSVKYSFKDN